MSSLDIARQPTAFDAGYEGLSSYWHPGGVTVPHPHGPCTAPGLREVVAEPPLLQNVEREVVHFLGKVPL